MHESSMNAVSTCMNPAAAVADRQQLFYAKLAMRIIIMHMHACMCR
jgi:acid stress-induced BolA-like protein IbaG/YrbA